jgi:hypothetical protein
VNSYLLTNKLRKCTYTEIFLSQEAALNCLIYKSIALKLRKDECGLKEISMDHDMKFLSLVYNDSIVPLNAKMKE